MKLPRQSRIEMYKEFETAPVRYIVTQRFTSLWAELQFRRSSRNTIMKHNLALSALAAAVLCVSASSYVFSAPDGELSQSRSVTKISQKADLKNILIIGTGGHIAGKSQRSDRSEGETPAKLMIETVIETVPHLKDLANISANQFSNIPSQNMDSDYWLELSKFASEQLRRDDIDGIVIAHGTDTLEETAYFLNLTVRSSKPIVLTGAMFPATAISADGPRNLYNAVAVAASDEAKDMGTLVVMNQEIISARGVSQKSTIMTDAFSGGREGTIGTAANGKTDFFQKPVKRSGTSSEFDISKIDKLPRVEILYGYGGADPRLAKYAIEELNADGLVFAALGNGNLPENVKKIIKTSSNKPVIVRSSRTGNDTVIRNAELNDDDLGTVSSNSLNPQKARILLMLALCKTRDIKEIQRIMNEY